jgi:hypothetical protein
MLLEDGDVIHSTDFCRPLMRSADFSNSSDTWMSTNTYGGGPADFLKWAHVYHILGPCWYGKKLGEYTRGPSCVPMEFVRGEIPESHILKGDWPDLRKLPGGEFFRESGNRRLRGDILGVTKEPLKG